MSAEAERTFSIALGSQNNLSQKGKLMPEEQARQSETRVGIDLRALELEIDRGIDALLVPAAKPHRDEGPAQIDNREQPETMESGPPASDAKSLPAVQKEGGPSHNPFEASTHAKYDEAPVADTFDSQEYHLHELSRLIEIFNAAYLSLDWEFSRENIEKSLAALNQLKPFASRSPDANSVVRIMEAILKRLMDRPGGVNSTLVQLIRDSQGLLAHMLLMDGEIGPHEKRRLRDFIERFQELRRRALAVKAEAKRANLTDKSCRSPSQNLEIIDTELARLRQIETILRRTPALVQIAQRLNGIGSTIKDQADLLRDATDNMQGQGPKGAEPVAETPSRSVEIKPAHPPSLVRRENLFLIALCGKCLGLPASCVLRVARAPGKKGVKILKRGYATLGDFTPPLRGIKSGVLGEWAKLPAKELKSYRFEPFEPHSPDQAVTSGPTAVLASDGQTHKIIFCQMVHFIVDAEIDAGASTEGAPGPFGSKSHLLVPVFDGRSLLSMPDRL